jgi:hypothetical protein
MNVLVIAPQHDDLPDFAQEIVAYHRHHNTALLKGNVRDTDISAKLDQLEAENFRIDILVFLSHGSSKGILLSGGQVLSIAGAVQYRKRSRCRLVVLNTCDSEQIALQIIIAAGDNPCDAICTVGDIANQEAIRLGCLLAGELAKSSHNFYIAFKTIDPEDGSYHYISARAIVQRSGRGALNVDATQELWRVIADLSQTVGGLSKSMQLNAEATDNQAQSIRSLTDTTKAQADFVKTLADQVRELQTAATAIQGQRLRRPSDAPEPGDRQPPPPAWLPYATPILLTVLLLLALGFLASGGRLP